MSSSRDLDSVLKFWMDVGPVVYYILKLMVISSRILDLGKVCEWDISYDKENSLEELGSTVRLSFLLTSL